MRIRICNHNIYNVGYEELGMDAYAYKIIVVLKKQCLYFSRSRNLTHLYRTRNEWSLPGPQSHYKKCR